MILVECNADETLVKAIAKVGKKDIRHFSGKSRVFNHLRDSKEPYVAMVDEDTFGPKHPYEKNLVLQDNNHDIKCYKDNKNNFIIVLQDNLEDWIIKVCKKNNIPLKEHGFPDDYDDLHKTIPSKLGKFEDLLKYLIRQDKKVHQLHYLAALLSTSV